MKRGAPSTILIGTVLVSLPMVAMAAPSNQAANANENCWQKSFLALDTNTDGVVSKQEATAVQKRLFDEMDKNDNGSIERLEYSDCTFGVGSPDPAVPAGKQSDFAKYDTNADSIVGYREYMKAGEQAWHSGGGDAAAGEGLQLKDFRDQMTVFITEGDHADLDRNRKVSEAEAAAEVHRSFALRDVNDDGRLSVDEWRKKSGNRSASNRFDSLDKNDDGMLSRDEFDKSRRHQIDLVNQSVDRPMTIWTYQWYVPVAQVDVAQAGGQEQRDPGMQGDAPQYRSYAKAPAATDKIAAGFEEGQLIGREVVGPGGQTIGQVTDILVDRRGEANDVLVEGSQKLGIGGKHYSLPIASITREGAQLVTDMTIDEIKGRPTFDSKGNVWVREHGGQGAAGGK